METPEDNSGSTPTAAAGADFKKVPTANNSSNNNSIIANAPIVARLSENVMSEMQHRQDVKELLRQEASRERLEHVRQWYQASRARGEANERAARQKVC